MLHSSLQACTRGVSVGPHLLLNLCGDPDTRNQQKLILAISLSQSCIDLPSALSNRCLLLKIPGDGASVGVLSQFSPCFAALTAGKPLCI